MSRLIRVAAIQHRVEPGNKVANIKTAKRLLDQAIKSNAKLIVLPEYFSIGFLAFTDIFTSEKLRELSEPIPGPTTDELGALIQGRGAYVVLGSLLESSEGKLYNTSALLGPDGSVVGTYRKVHLWTVPPRNEDARGVLPGDNYPVFDTEFGKLGITVGVDIDNPEPWRVLALRGAEIIAWPGICPWAWLDAWRFLGQARAFENLCYVITTNRVGEQFFGKSRIVSPSGGVIASLEGDEGVLVEEIDLERVVKMRGEPWSPLRRRYPATYSEISRSR